MCAVTALQARLQSAEAKAEAADKSAAALQQQALTWRARMKKREAEIISLTAKVCMFKLQLAVSGSSPGTTITQSWCMLCEHNKKCAWLAKYICITSELYQPLRDNIYNTYKTFHVTVCHKWIWSCPWTLCSHWVIACNALNNSVVPDLLPPVALLGRIRARYAARAAACADTSERCQEQGSNCH